MIVTIYTFAVDNDSGLNTYCHSSMKSLRDDMIDTFSAAIDEDRDSSYFETMLKGLNPDSEKWDDLLEEFFDDEGASNNYYSWSEHKVEVPIDPFAIVYLDGGMVQEVVTSEDCLVMTIDYDIEGTSETPIKVNGRLAIVDTWMPDPPTSAIDEALKLLFPKNGQKHTEQN